MTASPRLPIAFGIFLAGQIVPSLGHLLQCLLELAAQGLGQFAALFGKMLVFVASRRAVVLLMSP
jgi:hypothetical protein